MAEFNTEDRQLLDRTAEVNIETRAGKSVPIWIVVADDQVYVRSVKGPRGVWWQRLSGGESSRLEASGKSWTVAAEPVDDQAVQSVSAALQKKYQQRWPGPTAAMLRPETLPTTLRLQPT